MTKAKAKTELVNTQTGEVLDISEMASGMLADLDDGLGQEFGADDLVIPRLNILQDLSPQTKERKAEYVDGARPGLIYNSVKASLDGEITFVPAKFTTAWIAWKPRPEGGLVNSDVDPKTLTEENGFLSDGIDQFVGHMAPASDPSADKVKVEVIKTPMWVGVARGEDGSTMPVAISFPKTFSKSARKMNTAISLTEVETPRGVITPPAFYHTFTLGTAIENSGENEWFGWTVRHDGWADTDPRMREKAKEILKSLADGTATVADEVQ